MDIAETRLLAADMQSSVAALVGVLKAERISLQQEGHLWREHLRLLQAQQAVRRKRLDLLAQHEVLLRARPGRW
jgi:hypothetical protein